MVPSRSARIAALMLLIVLLGWKVRSGRKGAAVFHSSPAPASAPREPALKGTFPDE